MSKEGSIWHTEGGVEGGINPQYHVRWGQVALTTTLLWAVRGHWILPSWWATRNFSLCHCLLQALPNPTVQIGSPLTCCLRILSVSCAALYTHNQITAFVVEWPSPSLYEKLSRGPRLLHSSLPLLVKNCVQCSVGAYRTSTHWPGLTLGIFIPL